MQDMNFFVRHAHLIWSVVFWMVLEHLHSGHWNSFRYSSTVCIVVIVTGLMLFVATLLLNVRLKPAVYFRRIPLLMMIGFLDFLVLTTSVLALLDCFRGEEVSEFWGENREVDGSGEARGLTGKVTLCSERLASASSSVELSLTNTPDGWTAHRCIGRVNTLAAGCLFARVVDPDNECLLGKSEIVVAKWSTNPAETFDFDFSCPVLSGRRNRQYMVKCELWFTPEGSRADEKIAEAMVRTNGWY